jgi:hypothetical protein
MTDALAQIVLAAVRRALCPTAGLSAIAIIYAVGERPPRRQPLVPLRKGFS